MGYTTFSFFFSLFLFCSTATRVSPTTAPRAPERGSHLPSAPSIGDCVHVSLRVLQLAPLLPSRRLLVGSVPILAGTGWDGNTNQRRKGHRNRQVLTLFSHPSSQETCGLDLINQTLNRAHTPTLGTRTVRRVPRIPSFKPLSMGGVHTTSRVTNHANRWGFCWQADSGVSPVHLRSNLFDGTATYDHNTPVPLHTGT